MKCYENLHRKREEYSFMKVEIIWKHFKSPLLSVFEIGLNTYNDFESYLVKNIREHRGVRQAYFRKAVFLTQNLNWEGASNIPVLFFGFFFLFRGIRSKKIARINLTF